MLAQPPPPARRAAVPYGINPGAEFCLCAGVSPVRLRLGGVPLSQGLGHRVAILPLWITEKPCRDAARWGGPSHFLVEGDRRNDREAALIGRPIGDSSIEGIEVSLHRMR